MLSAGLQDHPAPLVQWGVVVAAALAAALTDIRSRRIPNLLTLPLVATGLLQAWLVGGGVGLFDSLLGCLLAGLPYVLLFLYAGGGAGDAKLMGALGAWLGVIQSLALLLTVSAAGIVFGLCYARSEGRLREALNNIAQVIWTTAGSVLAGGGLSSSLSAGSPSSESALKMPYGVAIFIGALLASGSVLL
jgi:prepilin peptidase CpaA